MMFVNLHVGLCYAFFPLNSGIEAKFTIKAFTAAATDFIHRIYEAAAGSHRRAGSNRRDFFYLHLEKRDYVALLCVNQLFFKK